MSLIALKGKGTMFEPYLIEDVEGLIEFRKLVEQKIEFAHVMLMADIDCKGARMLYGGLSRHDEIQWASGEFDGNGHIIRNIEYLSSGLFGVVGAVHFSNLGLEFVSEFGGYICDGARLSIFENCYVIVGEGERMMGGVVGTMYHSSGYDAPKTKLINCYTNVCDDSKRRIDNSYFEFKNCFYSTCEQLKNGEVAYLLGDAYGQYLGDGGDRHPVFRKRDNSNRVFKVSYKASTGALIGTSYSNSTLEVCYLPEIWEGKESKWSLSVNGTAVTKLNINSDTALYYVGSAEFEKHTITYASKGKVRAQQQIRYGEPITFKEFVDEKLKCKFVWNVPEFMPDKDIVLEAVSITITEAPGSDGYYMIDNAEKLFAFASMVNSGQCKIKARLAANLDLNPGITFNEYGFSPSDANPVRWTPIGENKQTEVVFDGDYHTIYGLYVKNNETKVGFICNSEAAQPVINLGIENSYFEGSHWVGSHIGAVSSVFNPMRLDNCYSTAIVKVRNNYAGGLVGWQLHQSLEIRNSFYLGKGIPFVGRCENMCSVVNSFVLSDEIDEKKRTDEQFRSGQVAWELNQGGAKYVQKIGDDLFPRFPRCAQDSIELKVYKITYIVGDMVAYTEYANPGEYKMCSELNGIQNKWSNEIGAKEGVTSCTITDTDVVLYFVGEKPKFKLSYVYAGKAYREEYVEYGSRLQDHVEVLDDDGVKIEWINYPSEMSQDVEWLGTGSFQKPAELYLLNSPLQLCVFSDVVNNAPNTNLMMNAKLTADIEMEGVFWKPIGSESRPYYGVFDGNGFAICNLSVVSIQPEAVGLFGYTANNAGDTFLPMAIIKNLGVKNIIVNQTGDDLAALLLGKAAPYTRIENCYAWGELTSLKEEKTAGLVGGGDSYCLIGCFTNYGKLANCEKKNQVVNCYDASEGEGFGDGTILCKLQEGSRFTIWKQIVGVDAHPEFAV